MGWFTRKNNGQKGVVAPNGAKSGWFTRKASVRPGSVTNAIAKTNANANARVRSASNNILKNRDPMVSGAKSELTSTLTNIKRDEDVAIIKSGNTNSNVKKLKLSAKLIADKIWKSNMPIKSKIGMVYSLVKMQLSGKLKKTLLEIQDGSINVATMDNNLKTFFKLIIDDMIKALSDTGDNVSTLKNLKQQLNPRNNSSGALPLIQSGGDEIFELVWFVLEIIGYLILSILSSPSYLYLYLSASRSDPIVRGPPIVYSSLQSSLSSPYTQNPLQRVGPLPTPATTVSGKRKYSEGEYRALPYAEQKFLTPHPYGSTGQFYYTRNVD